MRTLILSLTLVLLYNISCYSQTKDYSDIKKNGVYAEANLIRHVFSNGFVSINYERTAGIKLKTNFRIGIYPNFESLVCFPLTVSWITKPLNYHHFEYGIGTVIRIEHYVDPGDSSQKKWFYDMPAVLIPLMYRYQKGSGLFFRAGLNLFVSWPTLPSPSLSIGYKF
jgi:hypothetical protein